MLSTNKIAYATWDGVEERRSEYEILTNPNWKSRLEWKKSNGYDRPSNAVYGGSDFGKIRFKIRGHICIKGAQTSFNTFERPCEKDWHYNSLSRNINVMVPRDKLIIPEQDAVIFFM